jgi:hypothetical protein
MTKQEQFLKAAKIADIVLAGGGVGSLLALSYFLYHYSWTGERQFTSSLGVILYYILPAVFAALCFASLKLKPAYKVNLAVLSFSLVVSMYGGEILFHLTNPASSQPKRPVMFLVRDSEQKQKEATKLAEQFGVEVDARDGLEVIADLREQGIDAVPFISPSNNLFIRQSDGEIKSAINIHGDEVIPLGGVSNKVTVLCNENGQWITYRSDQRGFNNPGGIWHSDRVEIAALGDSFAQGYCVPMEKSFVGLIRQRFPATLNLGIAGNGPLLMLATVKEYLPRFKPKIVLWFYCEGNDLVNLQDEKKSRLLMRYLKDDFNQVLLAEQDKIDQALMNDISRQEALERERRAVRLANRRNIVPELFAFVKLTALRQRLQLVQGAKAQELELLSEVQGPNMDLFRDILSQVKARVSAWGGTLYFVYLPSWTRYFDTPEIGVKERTQVLNLVASLGIPLIDIHPVFQAQSDLRSLFPFRETGHYNEKGHQLVAEEVLKAISSGKQSSPTGASPIS